MTDRALGTDFQMRRQAALNREWEMEHQCDHEKAEKGWSPDQVAEVRAFAFGVTVIEGDDRVHLKQAVSSPDGDVVVFSILSPEDTRAFATELLRGADVASGQAD